MLGMGQKICVPFELLSLNVEVLFDAVFELELGLAAARGCGSVGGGSDIARNVASLLNWTGESGSNEAQDGEALHVYRCMGLCVMRSSGSVKRQVEEYKGAKSSPAEQTD